MDQGSPSRLAQGDTVLAVSYEGGRRMGVDQIEDDGIW